MTNDLISRAWRLAISVSVLASAALTLAAGYRWH